MQNAAIYFRLTPSFWKNSNAALILLFALSRVSLPSSHGRHIVGKPNGSAPDNNKKKTIINNIKIIDTAVY
jgi:hypothetical protein